MGAPDAGISRSAARFLGGRVVVADGMTFAGKRAALTAFDLATGDVRRLFELDEDLGISKLAVSPEHELLIAAIDEPHFPGRSEIQCLKIDGTEQTRYKLEIGLYDIAIAGDRTLVAAGSWDYGNTEVFVLDAASGQIMARRALGPQIGAEVANAPTGGQVAVAYDRDVEICSIETLKPELKFQLGDEHACSVAWSPDGAWIAVGTLERTVRLFHAATGTEHLA